ncbi:hypothetical protein Pelo_6623 [Pelomyxa schiedti]|nr:hypothetical protein Pelo_6623 [Pelomyxa schiedti]
MFFVNGCEVLAKLPDQERVETFKVKAKCILGLDKGDSCCTSTADSTSTFPSPSTGGYIRDMLNPHRPLTQQRKPFKRYSHTFPRRQKVLTLPQSRSQPEVQEKPQSEKQRKNQHKNRKRKSTETATTEATTTANTNTSTAAVSTPPASLPPPPQIVPSSPSDNDNNADADKETPTEPSPKVNRPNTSSQ